MVKLNGNAIILTRGDSMQIQLALSKGGNPFTPETDDVIKFSVSNVPKGKCGYVLLISKTINNNTLVLELLPEDTATMAYGTYIYDLEITYADGKVDTFLKGTITLTEEVG